MAGRSFELQRELGEGAFGTVYLADMVSMGGFRKSVALKLLKPDWDTASDAARRLRDEARLLGRLRHRHIVQVDDLIRLDGRWAVVMEYVPGVDLERLVASDNDDRVSPVVALEMTAAVALALDAAFNSQGDEGEPLRVVHRDIKPSNIRVTAAGDLKVLDFGIARADFQGREAKTDKVRYGSLGYMSPERLLGDPEVPAGDVFAVGAVLYELLVGTPYGRVKLAPDKAEAQLEERLHTAAQVLEPEVAPALELIRERMAYEVEDRPSSAEVAVRARVISRQMSGEDLFSYARRVVPKVQAATSGQPVTRRMLTGQLDSTTFALDGGVSVTAAVPEPTIEHAVGAPPTLEDLPTDRGGLSLGAIVGALFALLIVTIVGTVALLSFLERSPDVASAVGAGPPAAAAPLVVQDQPPPPGQTEGAATAQTEQPALADETAGSATAGAATTTAPLAAAAAQPTAPVAAAPVAAAPVAAAPVAAAPAAAAPTAAEDVSRVKFFVTGASMVSATCGGVSNSSTSASVNLVHFPAGSCRLRATIDGVDYQHRIEVRRPNGYTCTPSGEQLTCSSQL